MNTRSDLKGERWHNAIFNAVYACHSYVVCFLYIQAKQCYEREEKKKELKKLRGEDTWMLPELDQRLKQIGQVRCCLFMSFVYVVYLVWK